MSLNHHCFQWFIIKIKQAIKNKRHYFKYIGLHEDYLIMFCVIKILLAFMYDLLCVNILYYYSTLLDCKEENHKRMGPVTCKEAE